MTSTELISAEMEKLTQSVKQSLSGLKTIAVAEAWKVLQLATATIVQIIEALGYDLSGPDKKALAMKLLSDFYDNVFVIVGIPLVPNFIEPMIHKYVKAFLMLLLGSSIDTMVAIFKNTGVFQSKEAV